MANTKVSDGAMRAADEIDRECAEYTSAFGLPTATIAKIIDRETGCADMLEALEATARWLGSFYDSTEEGNDATMRKVGKALELASAAISRARGGAREGVAK